MIRAAALIALIAGCGDNLPHAMPDDSGTIELSFPSVPNRKLDLLFVIYNSPGGEETSRLGAEVGAVLAPLKVGEELPDLHIGVVTTDLGTTGSSDPSRPGATLGLVGGGGCSEAGNDGRLLTFGAPVTDAFFIDERDGAGGRRRNYQGELADVLGTAIRGAGQGGCAFEQPLHAIRRALAQPLNAGFVRLDAHLAIVIVTAEDDCSVLDAGFFTTDTSVLGEITSYRCTRQGVVCEQSLDEIGEKTGCRSREDSAFIEPIELTAGLLRSFKSSPAQLSIGAIVPPSTPFIVGLQAPPGGGTPRLALEPCVLTARNGIEVTTPAVRLPAFARSFGGRGAVTSSCATYGPALGAVARVFKHPLGVVCLDSSTLADRSPEPGIQPACVLAEIDGETERMMPRCPLGDACFDIVADPEACPETVDHLRLVVQREVPASSGAYIRARCETGTVGPGEVPPHSDGSVPRLLSFSADDVGTRTSTPD